MAAAGELAGRRDKQGDERAGVRRSVVSAMYDLERHAAGLYAVDEARTNVNGLNQAVATATSELPRSAIEPSATTNACAAAVSAFGPRSEPRRAARGRWR